MFLYVEITEVRFLLGCIATRWLCDPEHKTDNLLITPYFQQKKNYSFKMYVLRVLCYTLHGWQLQKFICNFQLCIAMV